jgi:3-oxoacyl-[acyl-carrier protein] reductase
MKLKNRVAIVTGAASGIGEACARRFATEGARVVIADIARVNGERIAAEITAAGAEAIFLHTDVTDSDAVAATIENTREKFGRLDIVMNNAGVPEPREAITDLSEAAFDQIFAVNVKSVYLFTRHAVPVLRAGGGGVIINTASTAAVKPRPGIAAYAASKAAVVTFTRALAVELAADRIRVNAILPVATMTPLFLDFIGKGNEAMIDNVAAMIPLKRLGEPKDMAACAAFLASDEAEFLTGVCLPVDGGWTAS